MTKRELIDTGTDKRYVRRDEDGKFKESVGVSRSLSVIARVRLVMASSTRTDILMMHGAEDKTIPSAATTVASGQLRTASFTVTSNIYPGVGHTISLEEATYTVMFLREGFKQRHDGVRSTSIS
ncbi:hypothetical protein RMR21_008455 [Agrobacterium sp. rho-8.1]|nr:hypothetical protein [Agrobacterium sp. rho-8.1]